MFGPRQHSNAIGMGKLQLYLGGEISLWVFHVCWSLYQSCRPMHISTYIFIRGLYILSLVRDLKHYIYTHTETIYMSRNVDKVRVMQNAPSQRDRKDSSVRTETWTRIHQITCKSFSKASSKASFFLCDVLSFYIRVDSTLAHLVSCLYQHTPLTSYPHVT